MLTFKVEYNISEQDLEDLVITAFEGGINYWCGSVEIVDETTYSGMLASEVLAKHGGELILNDCESDDHWSLTRDNLLKAIPAVMTHFGYGTVREIIDEHDVEVADVLIQYALFDKIVFG